MKYMYKYVNRAADKNDQSEASDKLLSSKGNHQPDQRQYHNSGKGDSSVSKISIDNELYKGRVDLAVSQKQAHNFFFCDQRIFPSHFVLANLALSLAAISVTAALDMLIGLVLGVIYVAAIVFIEVFDWAATKILFYQQPRIYAKPFSSKRGSAYLALITFLKPFFAARALLPLTGLALYALDMDGAGAMAGLAIPFCLAHDGLMLSEFSTLQEKRGQANA